LLIWRAGLKCGKRRLEVKLNEFVARRGVTMYDAELQSRWSTEVLCMNNEKRKHEKAVNKIDNAVRKALDKGVSKKVIEDTVGQAIVKAIEAVAAKKAAVKKTPSKKSPAKKAVGKRAVAKKAPVDEAVPKPV
jgi:hypothetical protein